MQQKNRKENFIELIKYIIFGVLTTLVGFGTFMLFDAVLGEKLYLITNLLSWLLAVIFSFITNKIWVFSSKSWAPKTVVKEALSFAGARVFSLGVEELGLWLLVSVAGLGRMTPFTIFGFSVSGTLIAKGILMVVTVILNYVLSKFIIFKRKKEENEK